MLSLITLICITSSGSSSAGSYLLLPLAWHLRVYVFITVLSLFISLLTLILHITGLVQMLPINWDLFVSGPVLSNGWLLFLPLFNSWQSFMSNSRLCLKPFRAFFSILSSQDLIVYSALAFGYLFGASLVASAVDIYQKLDTHVSRWTLEQLIISVVSLLSLLPRLVFWAVFLMCRVRSLFTDGGGLGHGLPLPFAQHISFQMKS